MNKKSIADASSQLYSLLQPFNADERLRIVQAAMTLLGDRPIAAKSDTEGQGGTAAATKAMGGGSHAFAMSESEFFESKQPATKIEQLAVAARYRELTISAKASARDDMKAVFSEARVNFDAGNFGRDIGNARTAGLFNKGGNPKEGYTLSLYGQKFIDKLPDHEAARALPKPTRKKSRKSKPKKT